MAQDMGYPPLTDRATVRVFVQRNLNAPRFTQTEYNVSITENDPVNAEVLTITATDQDGVSTHVTCLSRHVIFSRRTTRLVASWCIWLVSHCVKLDVLTLMLFPRRRNTCSQSKAHTSVCIQGRAPFSFFTKRFSFLSHSIRPIQFKEMFLYVAVFTQFVLRFFSHLSCNI